MTLLSRAATVTLLGLAASLLAAALAVVLLTGWPSGPFPNPSVAIGGPFALVDQNGVAISEKTFLGKPTAYFFGYTHCPEACPTTLMDMTDRLAALGADGDRFNVVFITIDPERDTPKTLKSYLESFDPRIVAATGTPDEIAKTIKEFRAYVRRVGEGENYSFDHSTAVYLMDAKGRLVTLIDYQEPRDSALSKLRRALQG
jgi:protein SCO1/2